MSKAHLPLPFHQSLSFSLFLLLFSSFGPQRHVQVESNRHSPSQFLNASYQQECTDEVCLLVQSDSECTAILSLSWNGCQEFCLFPFLSVLRWSVVLHVDNDGLHPIPLETVHHWFVEKRKEIRLRRHFSIKVKSEICEWRECVWSRHSNSLPAFKCRALASTNKRNVPS